MISEDEQKKHLGQNETVESNIEMQIDKPRERGCPALMFSALTKILFFVAAVENLDVNWIERN